MDAGSVVVAVPVVVAYGVVVAVHLYVEVTGATLAAARRRALVGAGGLFALWSAVNLVVPSGTYRSWTAEACLVAVALAAATVDATRARTAACVLALALVVAERVESPLLTAAALASAAEVTVAAVGEEFGDAIRVAAFTAAYAYALWVVWSGDDPRPLLVCAGPLALAVWRDEGYFHRRNQVVSPEATSSAAVTNPSETNPTTLDSGAEIVT